MAVKVLFLFGVALLILMPSFGAGEADDEDQRDEEPTKEGENHPDADEHRPIDGPTGEGGRPWGKRRKGGHEHDHDHDHDHDHYKRGGPKGHDGRRGGPQRRSCRFKAAIIIGSVLIFVMLLVFIGFCVFRKRKGADKTCDEVKTIPTVFIEPPNTMPTINNSTVPVKLVNEA